MNKLAITLVLLLGLCAIVFAQTQEAQVVVVDNSQEQTAKIDANGNIIIENASQPGAPQPGAPQPVVLTPEELELYKKFRIVEEEEKLQSKLNRYLEKQKAKSTQPLGIPIEYNFKPTVELTEQEAALYRKFNAYQVQEQNELLRQKELAKLQAKEQQLVLEKELAIEKIVLKEKNLLDKPPKAQPPKVQPPKAQPPKVKPPKVQPPKAKPQKVKPKKVNKKAKQQKNKNKNKGKKGKQ